MAIKLGPTQPEAYSQLAHVLRTVGRGEEAKLQLMLYQQKMMAPKTRFMSHQSK